MSERYVASVICKLDALCRIFNIRLKKVFFNCFSKFWNYFVQGGSLQADAPERAVVPLPGMRGQVHDKERQMEPQLQPQGRRPHQVWALL